MPDSDMDNGEPSKTEVQNIAYERLARYLQEQEDNVCEIEILPPAVQPPDGVLMQDGLNLGIPKKVLVLAYIEARRRFFDCKDHVKSSSIALQATKVMLLFDPEHLTAANYRKRWIIGMENRGGFDHQSLYHRALRRELSFLNTILTSPLHRQTKSPTLWHHRRWLLDLLWKAEFQGGDTDQRSTFLRAELAAVCKSGERHSKNYYAWQYARRLVPRMACHDKEDSAHVVKDWCCQHPSDISGWTFLLGLLSSLCGGSKAYDLFVDIMKYTVTLQAEQESLWIFIKRAGVLILTQKEYLAVCMLLKAHNEESHYIGHATIIPEKESVTPRWSILRNQFLHLRDDPVDHI